MNSAPWSLALLLLLAAAGLDRGADDFARIADRLAADPFLASARLAERGPDAAPAIRAALRDGRAEVRRGAAFAAGRIDDDGGIAALLVARLEDPDDAVRAAAAWALGRRRTAVPGAVAALDRLLEDPSDAARRSAAVALGRIGPPAAPALARRLSDAPPGPLEEAVRALAATDETPWDEARRLSSLLRHPAPGVRLAAAVAVWRHRAVEYDVRGTFEALALLLLAGDRVEERLLAAASLPAGRVDLGPTRFAALLALAADDSSPAVRHAVARAASAAWALNPRVADTVLGLREDPEPRVRAAAGAVEEERGEPDPPSETWEAEALRRLGPILAAVAGRRPLPPWADDACLTARRAILALARIRGDAAERILLRIARDGDAFARAAATRALGAREEPSPAARRALAALLRDPDGWVRVEAARELLSDPERSPAARAILSGSLRNADPAVRWFAARAPAPAGSEAGIPRDDLFPPRRFDEPSRHRRLPAPGGRFYLVIRPTADGGPSYALSEAGPGMPPATEDEAGLSGGDHAAPGRGVRRGDRVLREGFLPFPPGGVRVSASGRGFVAVDDRDGPPVLRVVPVAGPPSGRSLPGLAAHWIDDEAGLVVAVDATGEVFAIDFAGDAVDLPEGGRRALFAALRHPAPETRAEAIDRLADRGDPLATGPLRDVADSPDDSRAIRIRVVAALGRLGDREYRSRLLAAADLGGPAAAFDPLARWALERLPDAWGEDAIPFLSLALRAGRPGAREGFVRLGPAALPALVGLLDEGEPAAARALAELGARPALPALLRALETPDDELFAAAAAAVRDLGGSFLVADLARLRAGLPEDSRRRRDNLDILIRRLGDAR